MKGRSAFTLVELLVVIAIIGILSAMLLPALTRAKSKAQRATCFNNLRQVALAIRLYADDHADSLPELPDPNPYPNGLGAFYKELVKDRLGLTGPLSADDKVFGCPADRSIRKDRNHAYTSYTFNGYEVSPGNLPRITGKRLSAIRSPSRAALVAEWPAFFGGSWHPFVEEMHLDARNVMAFVDGHVAQVKIYWNGIPGASPRHYEPPASYAYSWSGE